MSGLNLTLKIWRQKDAKTKGQFETVKINDDSPDMSFLEMLDIVKKMHKPHDNRHLVIYI